MCFTRDEHSLWETSQDAQYEAIKSVDKCFFLSFCWKWQQFCEFALLQKKHFQSWSSEFFSGYHNCSWLLLSSLKSSERSSGILIFSAQNLPSKNNILSPFFYFFPCKLSLIDGKFCAEKMKTPEDRREFWIPETSNPEQCCYPEKTSELSLNSVTLFRTMKWELMFVFAKKCFWKNHLNSNFVHVPKSFQRFMRLEIW